MYIRAAAALLVAAIVVWLVRAFKPSKLGIVWGMLMLYAPVSHRFPISIVPLVNGLTMTAVLILLFRQRRDADSSVSGRGLRLLLLMWIGISGVGFAETLAAGGDMSNLLPLFKRWLDPIVFAWLGLCIVRREDRQFAVACLAVAYAIVGLHAVREGLDLGPLKRGNGLLGQANETGAFLAMYAPLLLAIGLFWAPGRYKPLLIGLVVVAAAGLMPLQSRGAMIGFAVGLIVVLMASRRVTLAALAFFVSLIVYATPGVLPDRVTARFEETIDERSPASSFDPTVPDKLEASAASRIQQWTAAASALQVNPIGYGFERFKQIIGPFGGIPGLDAHNFFVLVAVECGIAAPIIVVLLLVAALNAGHRAFRQIDAADRALGLGIMGMVASTIVVNMFGSRLMQSGPSMAFWALVSMAASLGTPRTIVERAATHVPLQVRSLAWR